MDESLPPHCHFILITFHFNTASQSQLEAIPGIGSKAAWRIISNRAKAARKSPEIPYSSVKQALDDAGIQSYGLALRVLKA